MSSKRKVEPEICEVPRWQMIKATLDNLDYNEFIKRSSEDINAIVIDVRTEEEHTVVNIPGSTVVDYLDQELADKLEALDENKTYYVYCRTGRRSVRVCLIMRNLGFQEVYNLDGGITSSPHT